MEFHHGKTLTADDVMFSLAKVTDPKKPGSGGTELAKILELNNSKIVDPKTILLQLNQPYAVLDQLLAEYTVGILPTDFDVSRPVGTGPFSYNRFVPGQLSQFDRFANYWDGPPFVDELIIYDFADDAAKVNALLAGQVQSVDNLPSYLAGTIEQQGTSALISETGAWVPFTMRVDAAPFSDVRVRQALRLIVDRQQMIDQALNGFGILGNDLYSPFDPAYAKDLPQRMQDIDQAKSLLKQAGQENLAVELVTSTAVGAGAVESANLFVEQAKSGRRRGATDQGRRQRLLRRPLPVLELRPGLLEHPQLRPAGGHVVGEGRDLQRDPLRRPAVHGADRPGQARARRRPSATSCCTTRRRSSTTPAASSSGASSASSTPTRTWCKASSRTATCRARTSGSSARPSSRHRHDGEAGSMTDLATSATDPPPQSPHPSARARRRRPG